MNPGARGVGCAVVKWPAPHHPFKETMPTEPEKLPLAHEIPLWLWCPGMVTMPSGPPHNTCRHRLLHYEEATHRWRVTVEWGDSTPVTIGKVDPRYIQPDMDHPQTQAAVLAHIESIYQQTRDRDSVWCVYLEAIDDPRGSGIRWEVAYRFGDYREYETLGYGSTRGIALTHALHTLSNNRNTWTVPHDR